MTEEEKISQGAVKYIKAHRKELIEKFITSGNCKPAQNPFSIFMAGSPGAGKTEFSKNLIEANKYKNKPVRIDADEIREILTVVGYNGSNSFLFQEACAVGVNKLHDYCLSKKLNFILDSTFVYGKYRENIKRSLDKGRKITIFYIYQDPKVAWDFVQKREVLEGRNIGKEVFRDSFHKSKDNVNDVMQGFGNMVELNLVIKDSNNGIEKVYFNIQNIDNYLKIKHNRNFLK